MCGHGQLRTKRVRENMESRAEVSKPFGLAGQKGRQSLLHVHAQMCVCAQK